MDPYCKIWTTNGANQNCLYHHECASWGSGRKQKQYYWGEVFCDIQNNQGRGVGVIS